MVKMLVDIALYDITPGEERGSFLHDMFKGPVRAIGERLHDMTLDSSMMLLAHKAVSEALAGDPVRAHLDPYILEHAWCGIGNWYA